jgi:hypothetical protein
VDWIFSTPGLVVIAVLIVLIATLIYWKREPIKKWLGRQKVEEVELGAGPLKVKLKGEEKPKEAARPAAGVDLGKGSDFTGARISGVAGRDIRRGAAAAQTPRGDAPGVDFGEKGKFTDAEIEDVAGRDLVEG